MLAGWAATSATASGGRIGLPLPTFPTTTAKPTTTTTTTPADPRAAAIASYESYIRGQADKLVTDTAPFVSAIKSNNITTAKANYAKAHFDLETVERVLRDQPDLKDKIDARLYDVPQDQWTGFHRLEKGLFADNSLAGLSAIADQLTTDVKDFQTRIHALQIDDATEVVNFANENLNTLSEPVIEGVEELYSHTDISDAQGNFTGSRNAFNFAKPLLSTTEQTLLESRYVAVQSQLDGLKETNATGNGFKLYTALSDDQVRNLSTATDALVEPLSNTIAEVAAG